MQVENPANNLWAVGLEVLMWCAKRDSMERRLIGEGR
jgi:hypothetical protein